MIFHDFSDRHLHDNYGIDGRVTDKRFLDALLALLRSYKIRDLSVADGAGRTAKDMDRVLTRSGYRAVLDKHKVPFINLNHYGPEDSRPGPWTMKLPWAKHLTQELVLADELVGPKRKRVYLIDVPKIKSHRYAVMTLSIKNLMGVVMMANATGTQLPWKRRWRMHRELSPWMKQWRATKKDDRPQYSKSLEVFSERLADLYGAITPDLVLLEGMPAMQGDGFRYAHPYGKSVLIASRNGCYADYVAAQYFNVHNSAALAKEIGVAMPPAILAVAKRYFGGVEGLAMIKVRGDVAWRTQKQRPVAWLKAMAPFELGTRPTPKP